MNNQNKKVSEKFDQKFHEGLVCPLCRARFDNVGEIKEHLEGEIYIIEKDITLCVQQLKMLGYG